MSGDSSNKTLDPSPVGNRIKSRTLDSMSSSSLSPDRAAEAKSPRLNEIENISSDDEAEESPLLGPVSRIGKRDVEEWRRKYHLHQELFIRIPGPSDRISELTKFRSMRRISSQASKIASFH